MGSWIMIFGRQLASEYTLGVALPVTVTTRIPTCLVGDPNEHACATVAGRGGHTRNIYYMTVPDPCLACIELSYPTHPVEICRCHNPYLLFSSSYTSC